MSLYIKFLSLLCCALFFSHTRNPHLTLPSLVVRIDRPIARDQKSPPQAPIHPKHESPVSHSCLYISSDSDNNDRYAKITVHWYLRRRESQIVDHQKLDLKPSCLRDSNRRFTNISKGFGSKYDRPFIFRLKSVSCSSLEKRR